MTSAQRIYLMATLWPEACKAQRWRPNDRARRMEVLSGILKRRIESANDIRSNEDFDRVKRELRTLANDVRGPMDNVAEAEGRRYLGIIRKELMPCLALYCGGMAGARGYVHKLIQDKFNQGRKVETLEMDDLSPHPQVRMVRGQPVEGASEIQQLLYTLNSRLNGAKGLRAKAGHSVAEMRRRAKQAEAAAEDVSSTPPDESESFETASADPW